METFLEKAFIDKDDSGSLVVEMRHPVLVPSLQCHLRSVALLQGAAGRRTMPVLSLQPLLF